MQKQKIKIPLSIIIITLNEEKNIGKLLASIKKQTVIPEEIIISDANSKDRTREIARSFGCKIVQGGLPAKGRNNGVKVSKTENILFLDADVMLYNKEFLENLFFEIKHKKYDVATCDNVPIKKNISYLSIYKIYNAYQKVMQFTPDPVAVGVCIFSTRKAFNKVHGFNEKLHQSLMEDVSFVRQIKRKGFRFGVLESTKIFVSTRRYEKEKIKNLIPKVVYTYFLSLIKKNYKIDYKYDHYNKK